jgi:hypothetical protein
VVRCSAVFKHCRAPLAVSAPSKLSECPAEVKWMSRTGRWVTCSMRSNRTANIVACTCVQNVSFGVLASRFGADSDARFAAGVCFRPGAQERTSRECQSVKIRGMTRGLFCVAVSPGCRRRRLRKYRSELDLPLIKGRLEQLLRCTDEVGRTLAPGAKRNVE